MKQRIFGTLLALLLCAVEPAYAAITPTSNIASTRCAAASTCSITLPSSVTAGDAIVVFPATGGATTSLSSLVDSNGTLTAARAFQSLSGSNSQGVGIYYECGAASGTHTITLTVGAGTNLELFAREYSGTATSSCFDVSSAVATNGTQSTSPTSASITPAGGNELLVGIINSAGASITFSGWGSSLSQVDTQAGGPSTAWANVVQTTGTAGAASATLSASEYWAAVAAFFKPSGAPTVNCTHAGQGKDGSISVPSGTSGLYWGPSGNWVTPDCSTIKYWSPSSGNFVVN